MDLTDLQKLDLKLTTRTALLLRTCSEIADTIKLGSNTQQAQGHLNDVMAAKLLDIDKRLKAIEKETNGD